MTGACIDCGKALCRRNVCGRCKSCFGRWNSQQPTRNARLSATRRAGMREITSVERDRLIRASRSRLDHIPLEYRAEYRRLTRSKMLTAAEASAVILDLVQRDVAKYAATGVLPQASRTGTPA